MRLLIIVFSLGAVLANTAYSQSTVGEEAPEQFVADLSAQSFEVCIGLYNDRFARYASNGAGDLLSLSHVLEAHRLSCESARLASEVVRLSAERERMMKERNRIEAEWQSAHALAPEKFPDFKGRDRSQKLLAASADGVDFTISQLNTTRENLEREAIRLVNLSFEDFEEQDETEKNLVLAAIDSESRHSIFDRFREGLPQQG